MTTLAALMVAVSGSHALSVCITSDTINGYRSDVAFLRELATGLLEKAREHGVRIDRLYVSYSGRGQEYVFYVPRPGEMVLIGKYPRVGEVPRGFWVCRRYDLNALIWIAGRDGSSYYELKRRLLRSGSPVRYVVYVNVSPRYLVADDPSKPGFLSVLGYWDGPCRIWYPYYYLRLLGVEVVNVKDVCPWYSRFVELNSTVPHLVDAILRALRRALQHGVISSRPPWVVDAVETILGELEGPEPPAIDPSQLSAAVRLIEADEGGPASRRDRARSAPVNVIYGLLLAGTLAGRPGGVARSRARG